METLLGLIDNLPKIVTALGVVLGAFSTLVASVYAVSLLVPGDHPDKEIKKVLDFTEKYSKKK